MLEDKVSLILYSSIGILVFLSIVVGIAIY